MRICDLRLKEVINCCDCKRLGYVEDLVFDMCTGQIEAIVVPGPSKFCCLVASEFEFVIPFCCISQVGDDIIIVKVKESEVRRKVKLEIK